MSDKPLAEMTFDEKCAELRRLKAANPSMTLSTREMWTVIASAALRGRQGEDPRELADTAVLMMELAAAERVAMLPEDGDS